MPLGAAMLAAATLMFGFQSWQTWRADSLESSAERIAAQARQGIAGFVSERQRALGQALLHPEVARYFASGEQGDPVRALAAIRERMPEVADARFIGGDVLDAIGDDIAGFGYANAEMLLSAARLGAPAPAQVHGAAVGARELVLVNPVTVNGSIIGFVLAKLPYEPLHSSFAELASGGIDLALVQGESGPGDVLEGSTTRGLMMTAVPGAMLRVGYRVPEPIIIAGPDSFFGNFMVALLSLAGTLAISFTRLFPGLAGRLRQARAAGRPVEQTLVEQLRAKAERPVVAAPETAPVSVAPAGTTDAATSSPAAPAAPIAPAAPAAVQSSASAAATSRASAIDRGIFRGYDIRGIVGKTLTGQVAMLIGQAVGSAIRAKGLQTVIVGRDGRLSGPLLSEALIKGLLAAGCDVIDIGAVPTPLLYFAMHDLNAGSCVMFTGSDTAVESAGFRVVVGGETLVEQDLQDLYARIVEDRLERGRGALTQMDLAESYIERISGDIQLETPLKVVLDCGNGIAGSIAQRLYEAIGCEVVPLYCEIDGNFPHHPPDPGDPRNLEDLIVSVKQFKADLGLAFDGDGDRLGVVTREGKIVPPDRLLMVFARDVLMRAPGASIIYDVKCSGHLSGVVLGHGGSPVMWKTGHSLIKKKMKETQAELAGEMSGHFFFKERWFGFDDGLYSGCRLLEIIAAEGRDADEIFDELPQSVSTPELKIPMNEGDNYRFIEKFRDRARFDGARITTIDGVRADWSDGWGLVRCSNTTPSLVLRFDAVDGDALARIKDVFKTQLLALDARLALPF
ncbi:MAG TPA: phosphomannomutase/phosphoglucomutase [Xanthomonadales bacterium]|nr:phosphomannomutase/phosphoglucomutase [Xanthomonadales bacterium]